MKRFNFFKYICLANKVHTAYFDYWFFNKLTQGGEAPTEPVEGEGTEFTLSPTSNKKLAVVTPKGDTSQNTLTGKNKLTLEGTTPYLATGTNVDSSDSNDVTISALQTLSNYSAVRYVISLSNLGLSVGDTVALSANISGDYTGTNGATLRITKNGSGQSTDIITSINTTATTKTFTIPEDTTSIGFFFYIAHGQAPAENSTATFSNIQLELGSTVTTYEPYCGGIPSPNPEYPQDVNVVTGTQTLTITNGTDVQTYPITLGSVELCKIGTYQDYIYKSGDEWYVHKENSKATFTGSETWYQANTNAYYYVSVPDSLLLPSSGSTPPVYCYYYLPANRNDLWGRRVDYGVGLYDGVKGYITIRNKDCADITAFTTWLTSHNTTVYYALATPTDTEITDTTLLSNLNTLLTDGYLKKGTNTIKTTATGTNLPTIIYIKTN